MRIILSSNPYRDKGLRTALEADRILRKAGAETVLCLPFVPRKGDRLDLPRNLSLRQLEEELPRARPVGLLRRGRDHPPRRPGRHPPRGAHPGGEHGQRGLYGRAGAHRALPAGPPGPGALCHRGADDAGRAGVPGRAAGEPGPGPQRRGVLQGLYGPGGRGGGLGRPDHGPSGSWGTG